ncbi:uncharacterized protein LOC126367659 [Pectinophora gossypiella]|uniref:uncharacterized protein LOC126367659 n=1 Tax=Pectinophora gossypiella TaxID=13191 RepID=UPI00214EEDA6|nr:uncharacterized protein LOC126367659 [Pectinophora gossypiella]
MGRRKKRKRDENEVADRPTDSSSESEDEEVGKYQPYKVPNYNRKYPENSNLSEYIVFLTHNKEDQHFTDKDRLALSQGLRKHGVSGVMHLKSINRYKVGITFDVSNNANVFLQNKKFLDELSLNASIPAISTEVTGVLSSVPLSLSNKKIFSLIGSSRNIIQVRRFMRRVKNDMGAVSYQPTQTVAVTFASTVLPEYVYLDHWRHEVNLYIAPVKQCLRCMRYGHIAKFCKNAEVCSICTENHSYRSCQTKNDDAKCANCNGNHVAISASCPIKQKKIEENKVKSRSVQYSDLFNENSFPSLSSKTIETQINNLTKSDIFLKLLTETILCVINNNSTKKQPINTGTVKENLISTLSKTLLKK